MSICNFELGLYIPHLIQTQSMHIGVWVLRIQLHINALFAHCIIHYLLVRSFETFGKLQIDVLDNLWEQWNVVEHLRPTDEFSKLSSVEEVNLWKSAYFDEKNLWQPPGKSNIAEHPISGNPTRALSKHAQNIFGNATSNRTSFKKSALGIRLVRQIEESLVTCESPSNSKKVIEYSRRRQTSGIRLIRQMKHLRCARKNRTVSNIFGNPLFRGVELCRSIEARL